MDLIGDISLAGKPIKAKLVAEKPGHKSNVSFIKEFVSKAVIDKGEPKVEVPKKEEGQVVDGEEKITVFDSAEIQKIIPHRYPILMIDRVKLIGAGDKKATGYKCVSGNEPFFQGHFPGQPIMPGVLIVEAMAQTSCVMFLSRPTLRKGKVRGEAFVEGKLVAEAEFMFIIVDREK